MAGLVGIGQSALAAAYAQLQTAGHNIANVHTRGFVRQDAVLGTAVGQYHGSGYIGNGVNVLDIRRNYDQFMSQEVTRNTALTGADKARAGSLEQVDQLLSDTGSGIGTAMDEFRAALADLVNSPADESARTVIVHRSAEVAGRFSETAAKLDTILTDTNRRIDEAASYVNTRLEHIALLNQQISEAKVNGHEPNDLLDQRDMLIDEVASRIQISRDDQADGTVDVYTASGHGLVISTRAGRLVSYASDDDPSRPALALEVNDTKVMLNAGALGSGEIAGLARFRDHDLAAVQTRLGQLAAAFAGAYNRQQRMGVDVNGRTGEAMFMLGEPRTLAGGSNTGNLQLRVSIAAHEDLKPADYRLSFDGSVYRIENTSDQSVAEFAQLPQQFDGLELSVESGAMAAGDVIKIQAASAYAGRMSSTLVSGEQIAAAYALAAAPDPDNTGGVKVVSFAQREPDPKSQDPVQLVFVAADRVQLKDAQGVLMGEQHYTPGHEIVANGWSVVLDGVPQVGDKVVVDELVPPKRGNGNAREMLKLPDAALVDGSSFNQSFASLLSDVGSRTLQARTSSKSASAMLEGARAVVAKSSGVNLDEEAARLLQYRQAYQAAAKVIQTADEMFNSILALAR